MAEDRSPAGLHMQVVEIKHRLEALRHPDTHLAFFGLANRPPHGARKPGEEGIGTLLQVQAMAEILDGGIDRQFERSRIPELEIFPVMLRGQG